MAVGLTGSSQPFLILHPVSEGEERGRRARPGTPGAQRKVPLPSKAESRLRELRAD